MSGTPRDIDLYYRVVGQQNESMVPHPFGARARQPWIGSIEPAGAHSYENYVAI